MEKFVILKIFFLSTLSFIFAIAWTPILTHFLYKYRLGKNIRSSKLTPIISALHSKQAGTPTMGGVLIWLSVAVIIFCRGRKRSFLWARLSRRLLSGLLTILLIFGKRKAWEAGSRCAIAYSYMRP